MGAAVVGGLAGPASAVDGLPNSVTFQQWSDLGVHWTDGLLNFSGNNDSSYVEGDTVPFLLDVTSAGPGTYSFSICRDYTDNGAFGYLSLQKYDVTALPAIASPAPIVTAPA